MGYEFFGEKVVFPFTPVPGVNDDQSLISTDVGPSVLDLLV